MEKLNILISKSNIIKVKNTKKNLFIKIEIQSIENVFIFCFPLNFVYRSFQMFKFK